MASASETESTSGFLTEQLRAQIRRNGPMSFHDWMRAALYDQAHGYYCRADRVRQGRTGDYRTAPETSPLFAAAFARFFRKLFAELGSPERWTICEVGAGNGDFAFDVLSTLQKRHPSVFDATRYVIDEVSPQARTRAFDRLVQFDDRIEFQSLVEVQEPFDFGIIFSNELIDAFPVHRVIRRGGELRELYVGLTNGGFTWAERDLSPAIGDYCRRSEIELVEGQIIEVNLEAEEFISRAASSLKEGFVITIDYGAERKELLSAAERRSGTLRAFRQHQLVDDVLSHPGEQDLTTTIDWTQIREAGEHAGLETIRHQRLDQFLLNEGLLEELQASMSDLSESEVVRLRTNARELIMPHGLAASFQVLIQQKSS